MYEFAHVFVEVSSRITISFVPFHRYGFLLVVHCFPSWVCWGFTSLVYAHNQYNFVLFTFERHPGPSFHLIVSLFYYPLCCFAKCDHSCSAWFIVAATLILLAPHTDLDDQSILFVSFRNRCSIGLLLVSRHTF